MKLLSFLDQVLYLAHLRLLQHLLLPSDGHRLYLSREELISRPKVHVLTQWTFDLTAGTLAFLLVQFRYARGDPERRQIDLILSLPCSFDSIFGCLRLK